MRRKLNDFEKVEKIQGQIAAEADVLTAELREVRAKLANEDKQHKVSEEEIERCWRFLVARKKESYDIFFKNISRAN